MKNLFVLYKITLFSFLFFATCLCTEPKVPRVQMESIEDTVIQDFKISSVKSVMGPIFAVDSRIAISDFQSPGEPHGFLVSNLYTGLLKRQGYEVIERDNFEDVLVEQSIMASGTTTLGDHDISRRLGNLYAADYLIFGAVTSYRTTRPPKFRAIRVVQENGEVSDEVQAVEVTKVGITAKVVDVKTAEIIWVGHGETVEMDATRGITSILKKFLESIQQSPDQPPGKRLMSWREKKESQPDTERTEKEDRGPVQETASGLYKHLIYLDPANISVRASNLPVNQPTTEFHPANTLDNASGTCWLVESSKMNKQAWIHFEFDRERWIEGLEVVNGQWAAEPQSQQYQGVKNVDLIFSDGREEPLWLSDTEIPQVLDFQPVLTKSVRVRVKDSYSTGKPRRIALSEVRFISVNSVPN